MEHKLIDEDFSSFSLGPFPYDPDHSAMGEYHYYPEKGYKGIWHDPIADWNYDGPSWIITDPELNGHHAIEETRIIDSEKAMAIPMLTAGCTDWHDYRAEVKFRKLSDTGVAGLLFRYTTSLRHYALLAANEKIELLKIDKKEKTVLASASADTDSDTFHKIAVDVKGDMIKCFFDDALIIETSDSSYPSGCIAISASMPAQFSVVSVTADDEEAERLRLLEISRKTETERVKNSFPKPELYKIYELKDFGAGRQLRTGHLTGTDELFFVIAQHQRRVYKDSYPFISCLTAVSFRTGDVLWQIGEPRDDDDVVKLTTDLPFQVYDINDDGIDEVIAVLNFRLCILDGRTGQVLKEMETPVLTDPPEKIIGLVSGAHPFKRLNADAIRIVNVSGKPRPSDILIKDRYTRIWIYDSDFHLLWSFSKYNTGHFPYSIDIDNDGKDEIFSCYNMIDHDGSLLWSLPSENDHTDEIIIGRFHPEDGERIAIVSGWEGFMLLNLAGNVLIKDVNGHAQRISIGNFIPENDGLEICTTTFWGNNGIIYMHDSDGKELWAEEMRNNGNLITPVNWDGSGQDLILLNGKDGMIDGYGREAVTFPDDGHPTLTAEVLDITGDNRDEIILWDRKKMYVYTSSGVTKTINGKIYTPLKYPDYNASNYRGEYSFTKWTDVHS